jgi:hypothetical protein
MLAASALDGGDPAGGHSGAAGEFLLGETGHRAPMAEPLAE